MFNWQYAMYLLKSSNGTEMKCMFNVYISQTSSNSCCLSLLNTNPCLPLQIQGSDEVCEDEEMVIKKWVCEYCTYSNWPSSMKCTMCRGNKPARLCGSENIFNAAVNNTNNQRGKYFPDIL